MTLVRSEEAAKWFSEPPPQGESVEAVASWAHRHFERLARFLDRPEFPGVVFSKITATVQPEFKAEDGLMLYAGAGVLGPNEGLYVREGGTWKKIT